MKNSDQLKIVDDAIESISRVHDNLLKDKLLRNTRSIAIQKTKTFVPFYDIIMRHKKDEEDVIPRNFTSISSRDMLKFQ